MQIRTGFQGSSIKFSPYEDGRIAVGTAQNFGIIGNGKQHVFQFGAQGPTPVAEFDTKDGICDCGWSEENENILASACGDGSIKVWDVAAPPNVNPLRSFQEHGREVYSLNWNLSKRSLLLSGSWDDSIKLWDLNAPTSLATFREHSYCIYAVVWNPAHADVFASASGDRTAKIWDARSGRTTLSLSNHTHEVLCCDWCKYNDCLLATGGVDKALRVWDLRKPHQEVSVLLGHTYAIRKALFSPHSESLVATCGYDMTVRLWDIAAPEDSLLKVWDHHTEFAVGLDWSTLSEGMLASAGWDGQAFVWHMRSDPRA